VTSAVEFGGSQQGLLHKKLEKYTGKNVRMHTALDKDLKGGLLIQIGDTVLDATIRHQLEMLKNRFLAGTAN
jgi:F-type H+-transporting ATPase subunit delta